MKSIYYTLLCYILGAKGKAGAKRKKMVDDTDGDDTEEKVSPLSPPKKSKGVCYVCVCMCMCLYV